MHVSKSFGFHMHNLYIYINCHYVRICTPSSAIYTQWRIQDLNLDRESMSCRFSSFLWVVSALISWCKSGLGVRMGEGLNGRLRIQGFSSSADKDSKDRKAASLLWASVSPSLTWGC